MERTTLTESLRRAEAEIAAGHPEQALAYCQELQTAYPRALRVQRVLGQIYLALRRPREALAALDRALAGDPEDVRACCARALVHQMHGDDVAALSWYGRACDLRPDDQSLRATYHELARRLGQPPYRPSRAGLARLYLRGDLFSHAIREWEQIVIEHPDMLDAQVGLAETLWRAGHARAAEERCRRILANAPSCVKAMLIQMALALTDGDMDTARAHLQRTLQLDPDKIIAQICFADTLAAGDPVMTALLQVNTGANTAANTADEAAKSSPQDAEFAQSTPSSRPRNLSRPLVTSAPAAEPAFAVTQQTSQQLPPPPRPDIPVASQPTEVTRAFKETAFMIWGKDEDTLPRIPAQRADAAKDAEVMPPPTLRELTSVMDEEEKRRALNWYSWLQSQGAVALGAGTSGPASPVPPPPAPPSQGTDAPVDSPAAPSNGAASSHAIPAPSPRLTMPIPPYMPPAPTPPAPPAMPIPPAMPPMPTPSARSTMPIPPAHPTMPLMPAEQQRMDVDEIEDVEDQDTAELPLPPADALRTMFAELGGNTAGPPVVESRTGPLPAFPPDSTGDATGTGGAGIASGRADSPVAPLWPAAPTTPEAPTIPDALDISEMSGTPGTPGTPDMSDEPDILDVTNEPPLPDISVLPDEPPMSGMPDTSDVSEPSDAPDTSYAAPAFGAPDHDEPLDLGMLAGEDNEQAAEPRTLEELERQFAASGFTPIETRPGLLAEMQRGQPSMPRVPSVSDTPSSTGAAQQERPADDIPPGAPAANESAASEPLPVVPTVSEPIASEPKATGPDPRDYPARLAHARKRRDDGQLDDALNEYRAIIKNAPDLLPDVLDDLRASLDEQPDHANLHSVLGDALVSQGDYEKALESYNKATELSQTHSGQS